MSIYAIELVHKYASTQMNLFIDGINSAKFKIQILRSDSWYLLDIWHSISDKWYLNLDGLYLITDSFHLALLFFDLVSDNWYRGLGIRYLISETWYQILDMWYWISVTLSSRVRLMIDIDIWYCYNQSLTSVPMKSVRTAVMTRLVFTALTTKLVPTAIMMKLVVLACF